MYLLLLRRREPNGSFSERKKIYSKSEKPEGLIGSYAYDDEITLLMRFFRSSVTSEIAVRRRNPPGQKLQLIYALCHVSLGLWPILNGRLYSTTVASTCYVLSLVSICRAVPGGLREAIPQEQGLEWIPAVVHQPRALTR